MIFWDTISTLRKRGNFGIHVGLYVCYILGSDRCLPQKISAGFCLTHTCLSFLQPRLIQRSRCDAIALQAQ